MPFFTDMFSAGHKRSWDSLQLLFSLSLFPSICLLPLFTSFPVLSFYVYPFLSSWLIINLWVLGGLKPPHRPNTSCCFFGLVHRYQVIHLWWVRRIEWTLTYTFTLCWADVKYLLMDNLNMPINNQKECQKTNNKPKATKPQWPYPLFVCAMLCRECTGRLRHENLFYSTEIDNLQMLMMWHVRLRFTNFCVLT